MSTKNSCDTSPQPNSPSKFVSIYEIGMDSSLEVLKSQKVECSNKSVIALSHLITGVSTVSTVSPPLVLAQPSSSEAIDDQAGIKRLGNVARSGPNLAETRSTIPHIVISWQLWAFSDTVYPEALENTTPIKKSCDSWKNLSNLCRLSTFERRTWPLRPQSTGVSVREAECSLSDCAKQASLE